jgi:hypothetical protein
MAIWFNVLPIGVVCGPLVYFFPFWYVWTKKNLATLITLNKKMHRPVTSSVDRQK